MLDRVDVILHRPQSSENIGAVARAMKNFGLSRLVMVSPPRYDPLRAGKLAVHAQEILTNARIVATLDEAIAPHILVIPTTERAIPGREPPLAPREAAEALVTRAASGSVALLFGEEAWGLTNALIGRFVSYSSIPASPERRSLNLAQAVLLYSWEAYQAAGRAGGGSTDASGGAEAPAPMELATLLRSRVRQLLLDAGFLNPQQPDRTLDELMRVLQRGQPSKRELEMLLAAAAQLERTSIARTLT